MRKVLSHIQRQQEVLDSLLAQAAIQYYNTHRSKQNFLFDVYESGNELWLLSDRNKKDLCYDRPSIGFSYSLWYQAKRVNSFLKFFINEISNTQEKKIEIFDLGAGAGAVLWAIGIVYSAMKLEGLTPPKISIVNIDTSPFMLNYSQNYLWPKFLERYPVCQEIETAFTINSWQNPAPAHYGNVWIVASYLFDNSENRAEINADFLDIVRHFSPSKILLTTSYNKATFLSSVADTLKSDFDIQKAESTYALYTGPLPNVSQVRMRLNQLIQENLNISHENLPFKGAAKWEIGSVSGVVLNKKQAELSLVSEGISLYTKFLNRRQITLNKKQLDAAQHRERPTKIIGPAGCGKSVVITERIKNLAEQSDYSPTLRILLTSFNKDLVKYLSNWLNEILDSKKSKRIFEDENTSKFYFRDAKTPSITVYHFDVLPTRIGGVKGNLKPSSFPGSVEEFHSSLVQEIVDSYVATNKINRKENAGILASQFILDEYHRIFYGYNVKSKDEYQQLERKGRGVPQLRKHSAKRQIVYDLVKTYSNVLRERRLASFTIRRRLFLNKLRAGAWPEENKFTHIFVDELQDCTYADYQIFFSLLKNPNNIVVAGDLAQSIQLGASLYIPKPADVPMRNWQTFLLEGSYRLPFRISEAIKKLSEDINVRYGRREDVDVSVILPYRGAPPGARLVIVYADSLPEMVDKIRAIYSEYKVFFREQNCPITIYENDRDLALQLRQHGLRVENETILKTKGLEKQFVFWSTRTDVDSEKEVYEFVYTILTRTSCVLAIGLSKSTKEIYHQIMSTFRQDRIIFWDQATRNNFDSFCKVVPVELITDEPIDELVTLNDDLPF